ncbi:MAG TPA: molecular chaperone GroEL [Desulfosporosinus sp.]|nr:molecular chaperone GroEL [Desulfosporosinus sp.]
MTLKSKNAITFNFEARQALARGVDQVADLVKMTLGPKGRNIVIEQRIGYPIITKDGVTVAKHINLPDPKENMGARLCREIASQTNDEVGDGTTTSIVLAQALLKGGLPLIEAGADPNLLKKGMEQAVQLVCAEIEGLSVPAAPEKVLQVASIAGKSLLIGELIAQAMDRVGANGMITVQETIERRTFLQVTEGMELEGGYLSPYFVSEGEKMAVHLENPYVLLTDQVIDNIQQVKRVLNWCAWEKKPLLIVAHHVSKDVLGLLISHNQNGEGKAIAVQTPGYGYHRLGILEDLAVVTGGSVIVKMLGMSLANTEKSMLGLAEKITVDRHKTTVIGGSGNAELKEKQIRSLKVLLRQTSASEEKEKLQERIARLSGGMAVIRVGAETEIALRELKDRVIDALQASKAAVQSGVVPGGGTVFMRAAKVLTEVQAGSADEQAGISLIQSTLEVPLRQIVTNAGGNGNKIVEMSRRLEDGVGYNALSGKFVDMMAAGIVDPAKVSATALRKAMGIASILLTTEGVIVKAYDQFQQVGWQ